MLDWLKGILGDNYSEDIDKKVSEEIGKNFVSKQDFNSKNESLKSLDAQLKERDKQLEELKKQDPEKLKSEIEKLQADNKTAQENYTKQVESLKFNYALENSLKSAKAKDVTSVKAHLKTEELKMDGDKILGLDTQIEALKKDYDYLFESDKPAPEFGAPTPGGKSDAMAAIRAAAGLKEPDKK